MSWKERERERKKGKITTLRFPAAEHRLHSDARTKMLNYRIDKIAKQY
jgi:hypothetical protein